MKRITGQAAAMLLLVALSLCARTMKAESPGVPPPSLDSAEITIPKAIVRAYQSQVHPTYIRWLANGDGIEDSLAAFELFLTVHPVNRYEAWCYTLLYIRSH
jgi:hypothetical protein